MATYADFFGSPIDQIHPTVNIYAVDDDGEVPVRQLSLVLTPTEGRMEIARGRKGDVGPVGPAAAPYIDQGDIANQATINTLELDEDDKGKSWRNVQTNSLHYWDGEKWIVHNNAYGLQGPKGDFGSLIDASVEMIDSNLPADAVLTGNPGSQVLELKIPTKPGPKGDPGTPGAIEVAPDYDSTMTAVPGDSLVKMASGKWGPAKGGRIVGPYAFGKNEISSVGTTADGSRLIAQMELPALPFDTLLDIEGVFRVVNGASGSVVGIEVRLGNPDDGTVVAKGLGLPGSGERLVTVQNWYAQAVGPDNASAVRVPANHTGTRGSLYLIARRTAGLSTWSMKNDDAQLIVKRLPVL